MAGIGQQNGVAVGGRARDGLSSNEAAGARTICNDDLLAKPRLSPNNRARMSMVVPAVIGTTMVMGRDG